MSGCRKAIAVVSQKWQEGSAPLQATSSKYFGSRAGSTLVGQPVSVEIDKGQSREMGPLQHLLPVVEEPKSGDKGT